MAFRIAVSSFVPIIGFVTVGSLSWIIPFKCPEKSLFCRELPCMSLGLMNSGLGVPVSISCLEMLFFVTSRCQMKICQIERFVNA